MSIRDNPIISNAVNFLFAYLKPDSSFKYFLTSSKQPCMTARIIAALRQLGIKDDPRLENIYKWLMGIQKEDGGWRCSTVKLGKSPLTDASNPGTTLYVLDAFRYRGNSPLEIERLNLGVDFLLQHWEVRQPIGPCSFEVGSRFLQIEYPFLRYNIFYYVYILSFYEKARNDKRFREAYNLLTLKTKENKIIPENPHKAWQEYNFAKKGPISVIAADRWIEIIFNIKTGILSKK